VTNKFGPQYFNDKNLSEIMNLTKSSCAKEINWIKNQYFFLQTKQMDL